MTQLPFMPLECQRFFADPKVMALDGEVEAMWLKLLVHIFMNEGWISADDHIIARKLKLDIRRWKTTYKPLLVPLLSKTSEPLLGEIYRQKRVTEVRTSALKLIAKNRQRTAAARAEKAAKAKARASATEPNAVSVTVSVTEPSGQSVTAGKEEMKNKKGSPPPSQAGRTALPTSQASASRSGQPNGTADATPPEEEDRSVARDLGLTPSRSPPAAPARSPPALTRRVNDWDQTPAPGPRGKTKFLQAFEEAGGDLSKLPKREGAPLTITERAQQALWDKTNERFKSSEPPRGTAKEDLEQRAADAKGQPHRNTEEGS